MHYSMLEVQRTGLSGRWTRQRHSTFVNNYSFLCIIIHIFFIDFPLFFFSSNNNIKKRRNKDKEEETIIIVIIIKIFILLLLPKKNKRVGVFMKTVIF